MRLETHELKPHWLMWLFGCRAVLFTLSRQGMVMHCEKSGEFFTLDQTKLGSMIKVVQGAFFSSLVVTTESGEKSFGGMRYQNVAAVNGWLKGQWYRALAPSIAKDASKIRQLLSRGYLRTSRWLVTSYIAKQAQSKFKEMPSASVVDDACYADFKLVSDIANWKTKDIEAFRDRYVENMKTRYGEFFAKVESNPLTQKQRDACIIDEDNNLVLAGAGTGKTSTMIGRAGFLIKEGLAAPEQILMLAFARKAADEMQERLDAKISEKGIKATTFHGIGKQIMAAVEGQQPSVSKYAEDEKLLAHDVAQWFEENLANKVYRQQVLDYFTYHQHPLINPFDFKCEGEYWQALEANNIRTFKGDSVKSLGECYIANFLFRNGIEYIYEAKYPHKTATLEFRQYQPDFYLPEYEIFIEHWGTNRAGDTAPYIDREKYHAGMRWKRNLHHKNGTTLVETYFYEQQEGVLLTQLRAKLFDENVRFRPLPDEAVLSTLREFGAIKEFHKLLAELLKRYKANWLSVAALEEKISQLKNNEQVRAALEILGPLFQRYQQLLADANEIDFDDMIGKALEYVIQGRFKSPWSYILVDEFQDISDPRARLVNALKENVQECSLFCVGDDWQSIYRFTGSDLNFTTEFASYFGTTKVTALDKTFRFNNSISDTATKFVLQNPIQLKKKLTTYHQVDKPAVSLFRVAQPKNTKPENGIIADDTESRLVTVLKRIAAIADNDSSVYLLARFSHVLPVSSELMSLREQFPNVNIEAYTMHASKGKEADYVVVLGLESGMFGFPSQKITHPLLDALLPPLEDFPYAEERRLFYVAMTRAKKRAYLLCDMNSASEFVQELLKGGYGIELKEFDISFSQLIAEFIRCFQCKTGTLLRRKSEFGEFYSCNNFPLCKYKENGCSACGNAMRRVGQFKICLDPDCGHWVPTCPRCDAELVKRNGPRGEFWGCKNFRGSDDNSCRFSAEVRSINGPAIEDVANLENAAVQYKVMS